MASRKQLKKSIKHICSELFIDCVILRITEQADVAQLESLMQEVIALNTEYIARINHTEKGSERIFYKKLRSEFTQEANRLSEAIIKA